MSMPGIKRYTFRTAEQWKSGASRQLAFEEKSVSTAAKYTVEEVAGTSRADRTRAFTNEYCGDLIWLRRSLELVRTTADGLRSVADLDIGSNRRTWRLRGLASGQHFLWLLARRKGPGGSRIVRFDTENFARRQIDAFRRPVLSICTDRKDGIWALLGGDE